MTLPPNAPLGAAPAVDPPMLSVLAVAGAGSAVLIRLPLATTETAWRRDRDGVAEGS